MGKKKDNKLIFRNPLGDYLFWQLVGGNMIQDGITKFQIEKIDFKTLDLGLPNIVTAYWIDHWAEVDSDLLNKFSTMLRKRN